MEADSFQRNPFHRNDRGCRCSGDNESEVSERLNLPDGSCGWCEVCGSPGHRRYFPGPLPVRGSWCDRHFRLVRRFHPLGAVGAVGWTVAIWTIVFAFVWLDVL